MIAASRIHFVCDYLVYTLRAQNGGTALMYVTRDGNAEGVRLLLEDGADTSAKDWVRTMTCCQCIKSVHAL